jgi:hypothetical protein
MEGTSDFLSLMLFMVGMEVVDGSQLILNINPWISCKGTYRLLEGLKTHLNH